MRKITLILGGARSGKSVFGERLALNKDSKPIYIFTAQSFDEEMDERIRVHKDRRKKQSWQDFEATINLPAAISELSKKEKVITLIKIIENRLGKKAQINFKPLRAGDVVSTNADLSKSSMLLGYNPKTDMIKGINSFIDWYIDYHKL